MVLVQGECECVRHLRMCLFFPLSLVLPPLGLRFDTLKVRALLVQFARFRWGKGFILLSS